MGYPVIKVTEVEGGIHVRQDRFLETGPAEPKDNETIWYASLCIRHTAVILICRRDKDYPPWSHHS